MSLEYHDFIVVAASLDAGWSRAKVGKEEETSFEAVAWERIQSTLCTLDEEAQKFADVLVKNYEAAKVGSAQKGQEEPLNSRLFSVQSWLPFGHLDSLALFAVDDLDAAHTVLGRYDKTLEEVTTAFCPRMAPFRELLPQDGPGSGLLVEFLDMMPERGNSEDEFQRRHPLALLSRFRLYSLLTMGRALTGLEAVCRLAARTVARACEALAAEVEGIGPDAPALYRREDIESLRVCFLDLQDEEELGIFVTGTNYTAMMSLVAAVQKLTMDSLIDYEEKSAKTVFGGRGVREVLGLGDEWDGKLDSVRERIGNCHLFRWSRTVAATAPHLSHEVQHKSEDATVSGYLGMDTLVGVMPGHQAEVEEILGRIGEQPPLARVRSGDSRYRLHLLGTNDLILQWRRDTAKEAGGVAESDPPSALIGIGEAIRLWPALLRAIDESSERGARRDFTGWESLVSIPIPDLPAFHQRIDGRHECVLHKLMANMSETLACLNESAIRDAGCKLGLPAASVHPLVLLSQSFGQVLTNPLIFDVVLDYIDLLETLAGVLTSPSIDFGSDRPDHYSARPPREVVEQLNLLLEAIDDAFELRLRRIYPEDAVRDWSLDLRSQNHQVFLAADAVLKCALAVFRKDLLGVHREKRHGDPDCAKARRILGVVLRLGYQAGMRATELKALRLPIDCGGLPEIGRLAIFDADFPHLRSILVYPDFFHESFHLILEELLSPGKSASPFAGPGTLSQKSRFSKSEGEPEADPDTALAAREMFVHMMMLLFVFDGDRDLLLRDLLEGLSNSEAMNDPMYTRRPFIGGRSVQLGGDSAKELRDDRIRRFARLVFDAFGPIVWLEGALDGRWVPGTDAVGLCNLNGKSEIADSATIGGFTRAIWAKLEESGGSFADFEWLFPPEDEERRKEARELFEEEAGWLYANTCDLMPELWTSARAIFAHHASRLVTESLHDEDQATRPVAVDTMKKLLSGPKPRFFYEGGEIEILPKNVAERYNALQEAIDRNIHEGWAGERCGRGYTAMPLPVGKGGLMPEGEAFDANLIVRRSLYHYLRLYRVKPDGAKTVPRKSDGRIDLNHLRSRPHDPLLLNRATVNHFCCIPSERRKRTGRDIAVLKTMWAIAARNRARRLAWIVRQTKGHSSP